MSDFPSPDTGVILFSQRVTTTTTTVIAKLLNSGSEVAHQVVVTQREWESLLTPGRHQGFATHGTRARET